MHTMEELNKNLSQSNLNFINNYIIMDIQPIPKPAETIKIKDIKLVKYLDYLYTDKWKAEYFNTKK